MTSYYIIELLIQHILAGILFITPQPPPHTPFWNYFRTIRMDE